MPLTHVIADLVRQQTTTTGTGTLSLGTVPSGCRGVVVGIGNGKKARYKLSASDGGWEIGLGTVTDASPDTFSRDVVYASSAGGTTKITLPTGTHTLDVTLDAKSANEMTPRLLNIGNGVTLSAGTLTLDCMGSCNVHAVLSLTANISAVTLQNVPERCSFYLEVTQSGGPWTFPQAAWPAGTVLESTYNLYTDTTVSRFWWTTTNGGTSSFLECNGPAAGATGDAYAASHEADTTAHPASNIVNTPAGNIAATTVQAALNELDSEKSAVGHTHTGVYDPAGTASSAVSAHVAAGDPHTQYALESALGGAAALNVGTAAGTVAAGNDARFIAQASAQYVLLARSSAGAGAWQEITSSANLYSFLQAATYAAAKTLLSLNNVANVDQLPRTAEVVTVTGNTTVDSTYNGKIIDCNSASAITLTFNDSLTAGFQCYVLRRGAGTVAIARQTSGTLNGAATSISVSAQWKSAFVFAYGTGTFAVDAG